MVDRNHHFPTHGFECILCHDTGLQHRDGIYYVCMAPHTEGHRRRLEQEAAEANETLRALERKTKKR